MPISQDVTVDPPFAQQVRVREGLDDVVLQWKGIISADIVAEGHIVAWAWCWCRGTHRIDMQMPSGDWTVADPAVAPYINPQESVVCINLRHQHDG